MSEPVKKEPPELPPELTHKDGWHSQYVYGWNACRKAMKEKQ